MDSAINMAKKLSKTHNLHRNFDIREFIESLGIGVEVTPLKSMSGFAYRKNGKKIIGINESDGDQRKRFTLAHELGHMLVHASDDVTLDKSFIYFRDDTSTLGTDIKEQQANAFAAELLMPSNDLKKKIKSMDGIDIMNDDNKISELAQNYGVSLSAMSVRIESLYRRGVF